MKHLFLITALMLGAGAVAADSTDSENFAESRKKPAKISGRPDSLGVYIPFTIWHNRWSYSEDRIERYNEDPGGFGFDMEWRGDKDRKTLYAMTFTDSNYFTQYVWGYAQLWNMYAPGRLNMSAGWTLSMQMRHEYGYIPIPLPLPIASVGYGPIAIQAAYVPGWKNFGNVVIAWGRIGF